MSDNTVQNDIDLYIKRVLKSIYILTFCACNLFFIQERRQQTVFAKRVTALQSHRSYKHLTAKWARHFFSKNFLLNIPNVARSWAETFRWTVFSLIYRAVYCGIDGRVRVVRIINWWSLKCLNAAFGRTNGICLRSSCHT